MAKPKILLIDADLKSRQMLEISLKKAGFTVTTTEEGEKALQLLDTYRPDLIISDIDLSGTMDGYLFCQVLKERKEWKKIPFVFLTTRKEVEDKIRGLELGVDDYLTKPIYLKEVIARARIIVDKKKQENIDGPSGGSEPLFQGDLSQMSIVDLLQTMEFGQKTGILHLEKANHTAKIYVKQGRVVHAVCDNLVGERAVYRTLMWAEGQFQIDFKKALQTQETIQVSTQALIMEGMRRIDELERIKEQLPPFDTYLTIDSGTILEEHPDRFPAKIENILAEFNGLQPLDKVVDALPYDDLESLEIISKLYFQGYLIESERPQPKAPAAEIDVEPEPMRTKIQPGGQTLDTQMLQLDEASKSIEEIKAKARMALEKKKASSEAASAPTVSAPMVAPTMPAPPPVAMPAPKAAPEPEESSFELAPPEFDRPLVESPVEAPIAAPPAAPPPIKATPAVEASVPPQASPKLGGEQARPAAPVASKAKNDEAARGLFVEAVEVVDAPPPPKEKQPEKRRPKEAPPAAMHVARIAPVALTSEAPKREYYPEESPRVAASAAPKAPTQQAPTVGAPQRYAPPMQVGTPQHQGQPYPPQAYGQPPGGYPTQHASYAPQQTPPQYPGQNTLTQFGDQTLWQLGEATILSEARGGNRKLLFAVAGGLFAAVVMLAIVLVRQQSDGSGASGGGDDLYAVAERAFQMVKSGEWASAQRLANEVLEQDPDVPVALYARGKAREQLGKLPDALADYKRAVEINPSFYVARLDALHIRHAQGDAPAALRAEVDQLLVKLSGGDVELYPKALILALKLDIAAKDWPRARRTLKDAQAVAGNDPQLVILGGQIPAEEPLPTPAAIPAAPAAKPAPEPAPVAKPEAKTASVKPAAPVAEKPTSKAGAKDEAKQLHEKGITFYRKGYLRNAQRTLEDATRLDPQNDEIWVDLGRVLLELGEDREAMKVFTTAGKIDPRNPRVWNNLGSLYMYQGDNDRARKAFETYLSLVPPTSSEAREIKRVLDNL